MGAGLTDAVSQCLRDRGRPRLAIRGRFSPKRKGLAALWTPQETQGVQACRSLNLQLCVYAAVEGGGHRPRRTTRNGASEDKPVVVSIHRGDILGIPTIFFCRYRVPLQDLGGGVPVEGVVGVMFHVEHRGPITFRLCSRKQGASRSCQFQIVGYLYIYT